MRLVGPRPDLFIQDELTSERDVRHVFDVRPRITGLSQISNIDMSTPTLLAEADSKIIENFTIINYFDYIVKTLLGKCSGHIVK